MARHSNSKDKNEKKRMKPIKKVAVIICIMEVILLVALALVFHSIGQTMYRRTVNAEASQFITQTIASYTDSVENEIQRMVQLSRSTATYAYCKNPKDAKAADLMLQEATMYAEYTLSGTIVYTSIALGTFEKAGLPVELDPTEMDTVLLVAKKVPKNQLYAVSLGGTPGESVILVTVPIRSEEGEFLGFIRTDMPFGKLVEPTWAKAPTSLDALFVDNSGIVAASRNPEDAGKRFTSVASQIKRDSRRRLEDILANPTRKDRRTIRDSYGIYIINRVSDIENLNLFTYATYSLKDLFSGTTTTIFLILAGSLILGGIALYTALHKFFSIRETEAELGNLLTTEVQGLAVASKETAATSQDQSAAVKEIVATMEDSNNLSENISAKIEDVSQIADKTSQDVLSGGEVLETNVAKLQEIFDANMQTIEGIKTLSKEIDNIWDIVSLITSVADQAKIIAFNAELEAASAGEAGKNFHIVASEVRRLADGIIDNTKEIKSRIAAIQQSSDNLILASESGTNRIDEGVAAARKLEERFSSIKSAAEITADSAKDITSIIQQQTAASGQILIALKQISAGVENFSAATEHISGSAENLKGIAGKLTKAVKMEAGLQEDHERAAD